MLPHTVCVRVLTLKCANIQQGYAHMTSGISQEGYQDWGLMGLGGVFSVQWIHKESLSFLYTQHILNSWNDYKQVQISRDGQVSGQQKHRCYKCCLCCDGHVTPAAVLSQDTDTGPLTLWDGGNRQRIMTERNDIRASLLTIQGAQEAWNRTTAQQNPVMGTVYYLSQLNPPIVHIPDPLKLLSKASCSFSNPSPSSCFCYFGRTIVL